MSLNFSKLSILVIDDNDFMRSLYRNLLSALGFDRNHILEASDGRAAIKELSIKEIDVAICDIEMQPMGGIDFTKYIRTSPESPNAFLPIIICTGFPDIHHIEAARDAGATEILRKPISPKTLYSRLRTITENPRPFISSPSYTGPDRRRRDVAFEGPDRRSAEVVLD